MLSALFLFFFSELFQLFRVSCGSTQIWGLFFSILVKNVFGIFVVVVVVVVVVIYLFIYLFIFKFVVNFVIH